MEAQKVQGEHEVYHASYDARQVTETRRAQGIRSAPTDKATKPKTQSRLAETLAAGFIAVCFGFLIA